MEVEFCDIGLQVSLDIEGGVLCPLLRLGRPDAPGRVYSCLRITPPTNKHVNKVSSTRTTPCQENGTDPK